MALPFLGFKFSEVPKANYTWLFRKTFSYHQQPTMGSWLLDRVEALLQNHMQDGRARLSRDEGRGGYNCHVCGDRFSTLSDIRRHS